MPSLPVISGKEAVRAFSKAGWYVARQRGSHVVMLRPNHRASLSIPQHKTLAPGTLRALLRKAEISVEEFRELI